MAQLQDQARSGGWEEPRATALLVLANGLVLEGFGLGAEGEALGEVCFNTAMTGYEEILTLLRWADYHFYLSPYRQCRHQ